MTCKLELVDSVFFVRWQKPVVADVDLILDEVKHGRNRLGKKLFYLCIIPVDSDPPSDEVRGRMKDLIHSLLEDVNSLHFVVEGSGLKNSIFRSVLTGTLFVLSTRHSTHVHVSMEAALAAIKSEDASVSPDAILRRADQAGLLTASGAPSQTV